MAAPDYTQHRLKAIALQAQAQNYPLTSDVRIAFLAEAQVEALLAIGSLQPTPKPRTPKKAAPAPKPKADE